MEIAGTRPAMTVWVGGLRNPSPYPIAGGRGSV
jgi:hypothetical protein